MSLTYLSLGSNLGDKRGNIEKALALITERVGDVLALSDFYETQSWGYVSQNRYMNAVVGVETTLKPEELLFVTQEIERKTGRTQKTVGGAYHDRLIDIDILLYDNLILQTPQLTIPHPLMHQRKFVLQPLSQIAPVLMHPVFGKTIAELYHLLIPMCSNKRDI